MDSIDKTIQAIARGEIVILVDDEDRENEGDLIIAADKVTPAAINFMAKHGRGLICLAMDRAMVDRLALPMMPTRHHSPFGTAFTVSIEARTGVTTGISAADRAHTIAVAVAKNAKPEDVIMPGHIFPLRACDGGVLVRAGQTEGSVDLARLAGLSRAGVICEIMNDDGTMARLPQLKKFAKKHGLLVASVKDLIAYRLKNEKIVERVAEAKLPVVLNSKTKAQFRIVGYRNSADGTEHFAIVKGNPGKNALVRVHSECLTGDILGSARCDCGEQLHASLEQIHNEGSGVLVYLRSHEGRGIGLLNKIRAYALQDEGFDTVEANLELGFKPDQREYGVAAQILKDLGLKQIRLMTNNPLKIDGLEEFGIAVSKRIAVEMPARKSNLKYLSTKQKKLGHFLSLEQIK